MSSDRRLSPSSRVLRLSALVLLLVACGKQGDPAPRPRAIPQAATDLTVRQRGLELIFEVGYPKATVAGLPLEGIASATLYEVVVPALTDQKAPLLSEPELQGQSKPVLELTGTALDEAVVGDKFRFRLTLPESALVKPLPPKPVPVPGPVQGVTPVPGATSVPGTAGAPTAPTGASTAPAAPAPTAPATTPAPAPPATPAPAPVATPPTTPTTPAATPTPAVTPAPAPPKDSGAPVAQARVYAFKTKERRGLESPWSNVVGLVPLITPPPPGDLTVTAQKQGVSLTWSESPGALGYAVLRRDATDKDWGAPLATVPASARSFVDLGAVYGSRYVYSVLATAQALPPVESAPQSAREVDYRDVFAPDLPTDLRALFVGGQVRLVWEASADTDLAGYRIERSVGGKPFAALPGELATGTAAADEAPPAGSSVRYRLVALDRAGNAAPPSEPIQIEVP